MTTDSSSQNAPMAATGTASGQRQLAPKVAKALARYRVAAFVIGVALLILVVTMVMRYGYGVTWVWMWGPIHGTLYAVYVLIAFDLSYKARWKLSNLLLVLLAGCVPVLSFVAEAWVNRKMLRGERL